MNQITPKCFCPFCTGPLRDPRNWLDADGQPAAYTVMTCAAGHEFHYGDGLLTADTPRIPGWVYTNMQTATNLVEGQYLYRPDWCEPGVPEDNIGSDLQDHWDGNQYRSCTVHWELNAPVPKMVLEAHMRQANRAAVIAVELFSTISDMVKEYYPNG